MYKRQLQIRAVCKKLCKTDTRRDTFRKMTFFHVLMVVQSESAVISNTIFFAMTILPFPYGTWKYNIERANKVELQVNIRHETHQIHVKWENVRQTKR